MNFFAKILILTALFLPWALYADNSAGLAAANAGNYNLAFQEFQQGAKNNDPTATYNLGYLYEHGLGASKNYQLAAKYYQEALALGDNNAPINLAYLYLNGEGVQADGQKAISYYKQAIINRSSVASAYYGMGVTYYYGAVNVPKNYQLALKNFYIASKKGNERASYYLGEIYFNGQGVKPDYQQAYNYFYKAKMLGDKDAEQGLAQLYAKLTPQQIQQLQNGTFNANKIISAS